jgi:hypothetical protein
MKAAKSLSLPVLIARPAEEEDEEANTLTHS